MKQNKKFEEKYDRDISILIDDKKELNKTLKELKIKLETLEQKLEDNCF